jgi:hypothetical protein
MSKHQVIAEALGHIFEGIEILKKAFPPRKFTIDGRLVGDIGEIIAALEYDVILDEVQQADHDGITSDGRKVQIKATFKEQLTFKKIPEYYLGFKLDKNGEYDEVFNGPGRIIFDRFSKRKNIGTKLLPFPISELRALSKLVDPKERIPKRTEQPSVCNSLPLP